jgi:hypothetical protein
MLRADFIFSYWIFAWFFIYIFGMVSKNPKFALLIALLENIGTLFYLIVFNAPFIAICKFIIVMIIQKIIPLFMILNEKILLSDIIFTFGLFLIYLLWLYTNNIDFFKVYSKIRESLMKNKSDIPGFVVIDYIMTFFLNKYR